MAETKTSATVDTKTIAPETKTTEASLRARVLHPGKPFVHLPGPSPVTGTAGKYRVLHGSVTLGHLESGETIRAYPGAVLELSAEEAGQMLAAKTVERLEN